MPLVLAAGEPGKEILYPVATVILGGLISSTLLDFFVHPALFWCFGRRQAEALPDTGDQLLEDRQIDNAEQAAIPAMRMPQRRSDDAVSKSDIDDLFFRE